MKFVHFSYIQYWNSHIQRMYGCVLVHIITCHTHTALKLRRRTMDCTTVGPFLTGLSLILFIPTSSAQLRRKLMWIIRRALSRLLSLVRRRLLIHSWLAKSSQLIALLFMRAAPTLAKRLQISYTINPSLSPLFTRCAFDGDPAPTISWMLNSTL